MRTIKFQRMFFLLLACSLFISSSAFAQKVEDSKNVRVKVMKNVNGNEVEIDTSFIIDGEMDVDAILENLGVSDLGLGHDMSGAEKIIIKRSFDGEDGAMDFDFENLDDVNFGFLELEGEDLDITMDVLKSIRGDEDIQKIMKMRQPMMDDEEAAKKPFLGVYLKLEMEEGESPMQLPENGLLIDGLVEGAAAAEAGIEKGDILSSIDGSAINSYDDLKAAMSNKSPGDRISVNVVRNEKTITVPVDLKSRADAKEALMKHDMNKFEHSYKHGYHGVKEGMKMFKFDKEGVKSDQGFLGVVFGKKVEVENVNGVETKTVSDELKVTEVVENSAAAEAGILAGDVVTKINDRSIANYQELKEALKGAKAGEQISVEVNRDGNLVSFNPTLKQRPIEHLRGGQGMNQFQFKNFGDCGMSKAAKCCTPKPGCCEKKDKNENKVLLGIYPTTINKATAMEKGLDSNRGVFVEEVIDESAASNAGLKTGDVLTKINKRDIDNNEDLFQELGDYSAGDEIKIEYYRDGKKNKTKATLKAREVKEKSACCMPSNCCPQSSMKDCDWTECDWSQLKGICEGDQEVQVIIIDMDDEVMAEGKSDKTVIIKDVEDSDNEFFKNSQNSINLFSNEELKFNNLKFYPNPNEGKFSVEFEVSERSDIDIKLIDSNGKEVYKEMLRGVSGVYKNNLDISGKAKGVYFLQIVQGDQVMTKKVLVK